MNRSFRIGSASNEALGLLYEQLLRNAGFKVLCERGGDGAVMNLAGPCTLWLLDPTPLYHESHAELIRQVLVDDAYEPGIVAAIEAARSG